MFKHFLFTILFINCGLVYGQDSNPYQNIIPAPVSLKKAPGTFTLSQVTVLQADSSTNKAVVFLSNYLSNRWAMRVPVVATDTTKITNVILITSAGAENIPAEGYHLNINANKITVVGKGAGLFYGIQTLIQLLPLERSGSVRLPCVDINDYPRFAYRGMHLDVVRHFFSVEFVKQYIDLMAAYKLNNFHWHLTDDQGWRIEIKKYPRLTQVGSQRAKTMIGNYHDFSPFQYDDTPYGGYYTQDQVREVIKYAADRYINIIPEIEMPGHSTAALAAYPEFSCYPGRQYKVLETWSDPAGVYAPTEQTFAFLQDVLTEVMELFPGKYIHIGGDEVNKDPWRQNAYSQKLIKRLKLLDEAGLQSYFIQRIARFVQSKGRKVIGWDEILQGGLAQDATVMSWRGESGGIAAAQQSHDVIMTSQNNGLYLDKAQGVGTHEPLGIGGYAPLQMTYGYNPVPAALQATQQKYIIGAQANLWTEYIPTPDKVEYMLLPRMLALAEVAWTPLANKNFKDFSETRLPVHLARFDATGINFRVPTAIGATDTLVTGQQFKMELKKPVTGSKIFYTTDTYPPRETEQEYTGPVNIIVPAESTREFNTVVVTAAGRRSAPTHMIMVNQSPLPPVDYQANIPGLKYKFIAGTFASTDQLDAATPIDTGVTKYIYPAGLKKNYTKFGVIYEGFIRIDTAGKYVFQTLSADGSVLMIDGQKIVNNDGKHSAFQEGGEVLLQKGFHKITIKYFFVGAGSTLRVYLTIPGRPRTEIPPDIIFN
jgi:hexosaminidase